MKEKMYYYQEGMAESGLEELIIKGEIRQIGGVEGYENEILYVITDYWKGHKRGEDNKWVSVQKDGDGVYKHTRKDGIVYIMSYEKELILLRMAEELKKKREEMVLPLLCGGCQW